MRIGLFDPGLQDNSGTPSTNLGDLIIQEAVDREIRNVFGSAEIQRVSTHAPLPAEYRERLSACNHLVIGGTNLLSSHIRQYKQWEITPRQAWQIRRAVLLGVGWWQYQDQPDWPTRSLLYGALSWYRIHSVRDEYTRRKLRSIGFPRVVNTGCPTMWPLANLDPATVPRARSTEALVMLTDYYRHPELDRQLLKLVLANYDRVYYWPQGKDDLKYLDDLGLSLIRLGHSLAELRYFLQHGPIVDYIGTRLHGGVACLLASRRTLVLEVDNRATEVARDTGFPTVKRDNFEAMQRWIKGPSDIQIRINTPAIEKWRTQF